MADKKPQFQDDLYRDQECGFLYLTWHWNRTPPASSQIMIRSASLSVGGLQRASTEAQALRKRRLGCNDKERYLAVLVCCHVNGAWMVPA
eukprot:3177265-Rhodomonas_salina.1